MRVALRRARECGGFGGACFGRLWGRVLWGHCRAVAAACRACEVGRVVECAVLTCVTA